MGLVVNHISKKIKNACILDDVSLDLKEGNIYGFVGENGSGKTMLFRALSGLMKIDSGEIIYNQKILGKDINVIPDLGIIIENAGLYQDLTGYKNLEMLSKLRGIIHGDRIREIIAMVGLDPYDKRTFKKYSLGMKQKILIAQALMEYPKVLMLDEPTNALDREGVEHFRKLMLEEKEKGTMILIASHNKEDIDLLADEIFTVHNGQIKKEMSYEV